MNATENAGIYEEDDDPNGLLKALQLDAETLQRAAAAGEAERRTCTKFDPTILGGVMAWARTIRGLREILVPAGWKAQDVLGLPLVVSPDSMIGITVATGDIHTGMRGATPTTKYPKGVAFPATGGRQLPLFEMSERTTDQLPETFWVLLMARTSQELRLELSKPTHRTPMGRIAFDGERILLPPIVFDQAVDVDDAEDDPGHDVDVERL